ncbi:hypothetical protein PQ465_04390 [Sphingobacterium oryzagri]|uniref:Uncharacterized protein n=1 Tax=Sphingobacterium oryzagri TaxID=3025669 RepID=A0ABY7WJ35_9SPHI|nr:hypothetical protein [Sphingobacterium sp. KACC 22765]WDF69621.1 hypothetical protein PQ465_04390 [Sphingobacterium sp. KACC 22765]
MKNQKKTFGMFGAVAVASLGLSAVITPESTNANSIESVIPTITTEATANLKAEAAANWILNPDWFIQSDEPTNPPPVEEEVEE